MWKPFVSPDCTSIRLFSEVWVLLLRCSSSTEGGNLRLSQRGSVWGRSIGISRGPLWMIRLSSVRSSVREREIFNVEKFCPLITAELSSYIFLYNLIRDLSLSRDQNIQLKNLKGRHLGLIFCLHAKLWQCIRDFYQSESMWQTHGS